MKYACMILGMCGFVLWAAQGAAAATPASYDIRTGDDLNKVCANPAGNAVTAAERERLSVCGAYIRGYLGYYGVARNHGRGMLFCLPAGGVSAEKLRLLYTGVLDKRPQIRDYPAAVDLASILRAAYPCKGAAAPKP